MSRYSDKSDFADMCEMHYSLDKIAHADVTIEDTPLRIKSPRDLIPYFGHIVASSSCCPSEDRMHIRLCKMSQPDMRERDTKQFFISDYVFKSKRAKRKKEQISFNDFDYPTSPIDRWNLFKCCEENKDVLMKHFIPYAENYHYNQINDLIIEQLFSKIHFGGSDMYRRNLLEKAAEYWGPAYKMSKSEFADWVKYDYPNDKDQFEYNAILHKIHQQVWEYEETTEQAAKELMK